MQRKFSFVLGSWKITSIKVLEHGFWYTKVMFMRLIPSHTHKKCDGFNPIQKLIINMTPLIIKTLRHSVVNRDSIFFSSFSLETNYANRTADRFCIQQCKTWLGTTETVNRWNGSKSAIDSNIWLKKKVVRYRFKWHDSFISIYVNIFELNEAKKLVKRNEYHLKWFLKFNR